jgi:hypothetical protein
VGVALALKNRIRRVLDVDSGKSRSGIVAVLFVLTRTQGFLFKSTERVVRHGSGFAKAVGDGVRSTYIVVGASRRLPEHLHCLNDIDARMRMLEVSAVTLNDLVFGNSEIENCCPIKSATSPDSSALARISRNLKIR